MNEERGEWWPGDADAGPMLKEGGQQPVGSGQGWGAGDELGEPGEDEKAAAQLLADGLWLGVGQSVGPEAASPALAARPGKKHKVNLAGVQKAALGAAMAAADEVADAEGCLMLPGTAKSAGTKKRKKGGGAAAAAEAEPLPAAVGEGSPGAAAGTKGAVWAKAAGGAKAAAAAAAEAGARLRPETEEGGSRMPALVEGLAAAAAAEDAEAQARGDFTLACPWVDVFREVSGSGSGWEAKDARCKKSGAGHVVVGQVGEGQVDGTAGGCCGCCRGCWDEAQNNFMLGCPEIQR